MTDTTDNLQLPWLAAAQAQKHVNVNASLQALDGGGALAAGAYGFDRWKAGGSGCTCTLSAGVLVLTAGALVQVVEPAVWGEDGYAGATLAFTADGLAGGELQVQAGSASATVSPTSPSAILVLEAGDQGPVTVTVAPASGAPTFRRLKLEAGARATPWAGALLRRSSGCASHISRRPRRPAPRRRPTRPARLMDRSTARRTRAWGRPPPCASSRPSGRRRS